MHQEYEVVKLKHDISEHGLVAGAQGTVLIVYNEPPLPLAYEVEFLDSDGQTLAVLTLNEEDIESV